ncbi:MAG: Gfo/Idh/MocA family oxidoreductase [Planctomycetes bacterium]|jgi:predicted dehydrogenase|nr:Gfo/Idh/MocA family oxidoreductase [Planctomycetota bacterium]
MTTIGMIGAGRWGGNWIRTLAQLPGTQLRWVCDVSPTSLDKIRQQFPQVQTTTRLDDLLGDSTLDGIVIATIAPTHFDVAHRALTAGKHVMVEKPMTLTTKDAIILTDLARRTHRVLMVGHLLEYHPIIRHIRKMIETGELGEVYYLYQQRLNLGTIRADENAWWSLAPHDISVANRLLGAAPVSVQCRGQNIVNANVADVVFAALEYPGGRLAHVHVSWLDPQKSRKLVVVGSRKMAIFDDAAETKLMVLDKGFQKSDGFITLRQGDTTTPIPDGGEPLAVEAQHFVDCIRTGARPISDGESGAQVVSVLEYGQRSLDQGGIVVSIPRAAQPLAA